MPPQDNQSQTPGDALVEIVYDELREIAGAFFRRQPAGFTLRPTELVNEACLHLIRHANVKWESPDHFRAIATKKIWQVVVDHLKRRGAQKRGGRMPRGGASRTAQPQSTGSGERREPASAPWTRVPLESVAVEWADRTVDLLDLAEALEGLASESGRLYDVVMLHWFGGMKHADVALCLGVSPSTVEKDFRYALAWLSRRLAGTEQHGD